MTRQEAISEVFAWSSQIESEWGNGTAESADTAAKDVLLALGVTPEELTAKEARGVAAFAEWQRTRP